MGWMLEVTGQSPRELNAEEAQDVINLIVEERERRAYRRGVRDTLERFVSVLSIAFVVAAVLL